jgi:hypothetical protein
MPSKKTPLEVGFINEEPEKAFFNEAHRILLKPRRDEATDLPPITDRRRLMEFIALAATYLRGLGAGDQLTSRLMVYYAAMGDLGRGVPSPMFMASKLSHSKPLSSEIWRSRARLAVALDYLMRAGDPSDDAAKRLARIPGITRLLSKQAQYAHKSIKRWRDTLRRGKKTDEMARMVWQASRDELASIDGRQGYRAEAERLIAIARDELVR